MCVLSKIWLKAKRFEKWKICIQSTVDYNRSETWLVEWGYVPMHYYVRFETISSHVFLQTAVIFSKLFYKCRPLDNSNGYKQGIHYNAVLSYYKRKQFIMRKPLKIKYCGHVVLLSNSSVCKIVSHKERKWHFMIETQNYIETKKLTSTLLNYEHAYWTWYVLYII